LKDKADRPIKGFSGGERQRLGIAQAQVNYPDLLILDEPAASLDPQGRRDVLEVMERLQKYTTIFYSTHILSDVQRVSDTVAILNKGRLVAEAPIEQLLAGSDGIAYTLVVQGDGERARQHIAAQPWVKAVSVAANNGLTTWNISVNDDQIAAQQLLRVALSDENLIVTEFGRKKHDLEEVFLNIVEGSNHVRN
jgi:ABC-2 type transport system ATP-binding protein